MRVVECAQIGPLDGLRITEHPDPEPGPATVLIDVEAVGVNYVDALFVRGEYQIKPPVPFVPGSEIAGTISATGDGVDETLIGTRVVAMCGLGGFAEKVVVPESAAVPIPNSLDARRAAGFIQSWCTARFALQERAGIAEGDKVLVLGAAGGVGQATIGVAVAAGAEVLAVASTAAKRRAALVAGARIAMDPWGVRADDDGNTPDAERDGMDPDVEGRTALVHAVRDLTDGGVDIALDPVGGPMSTAALRSLRLFGRLLVIGFPAGIPELPANQILLRNRTVAGVDWGAWAMRHPADQRRLLEGLLDDVAAGRITPAAPQIRPLDEAVSALEDLLGRRTSGKVVLVP